MARRSGIGFYGVSDSPNLGDAFDFTDQYSKVANMSAAIVNLNQAQKRNEQSNEMYGLEKKQKELEIKKLEALDFSDPEYIQAKKDELKAESNLNKSKYEYFNLQYGNANKALKTELESGATFLKGANFGAQFNPATGKMEKPNATERYRMDLQRLQSGEIKKDHMKFLYPDRRDDIDQFNTELQKENVRGVELENEPLKKGGFMGFGGVNEATLEKAKSIKSYGDLIDIYENRDALDEVGVDLQPIVDHYKEEFVELAEKGYIGKGKK